MAIRRPWRSRCATAVSAIAPEFRCSTSGRWRSGFGSRWRPSRFNTLLLTLLGAIGVVLAAVGIYGVIAYFVTRRTQEIGVRMALGATRRDVVALVVKQAAWPVAAGIVLGIVISAALTRVLSGQLFGVKPHDPATFALVAIGLAAVALVASLVPARRAASVDPTRALHSN